MLEEHLNPDPRGEHARQQREGKPRSVKLPLAIGLVLLGLFTVGAWYLRSDHFREYVRARLMTALNEATGGKAQIGSLQWNLSKLEFELHDITVRGNEPAGEAPFAHIDRLLVRAKIISLFSSEIGLRYIEADRPQVHLITYPDGSTNLPRPKRVRVATNPIDQLFSLAVEQAVISEGMIVWNDHPMPLDFSTNDLTATMAYDAAADRYDGRLQFGKLEAKYKTFRPLAANSEVDFSIFRTKFQLKAFRLSSGKTNVEASGELVDFHDPKVKLTYNALVDLAQAGAIMRNPQLQGGLATLNGRGTWTPADFDTAGQITLRQVAVQLDQIRVQGIDAGGDFSLDKRRLDLMHLVAHALGGEMKGDARIVNWSSPPQARELAAQKGTAHLEVKGVQLATVARELTSRALPVDKAGVVGALHGTVDVDWTGSAANAVAVVKGEVAPPAQPTTNQVPLTARVNATYFGGRKVLEVAQFNAATRATRLSAAGSIGTSNANVRVALTSTNLGEFTPAMVAYGGPAKVPVELGGAATFNGTVSGAVSAPTISGRLQATDFVTVFKVPQSASSGLQSVAAKPATSATMTERRIHWDSLTADLLYSRDRVAASNGVLQRGKSQVAFSVDAAAHNGKVLQTTPLNARVNIRNADVADIQAMAGYNYPFTGTLNLNVNATGTMADPRGSGQLSLTNGTAYDEQLKSLSANIRIANHNVELSNIALVTNAGEVTGTAAYNVNAKSFQFNLQGNNLDIAQLKQGQQLGLTGRATFNAQGSGTTEAPVLNATLRVQDLTVNGEQVGALSADAITRGQDMRITASTRYGDAQLQLSGNVNLRGDFQSSLHLHVANFDFDPLLKRFLQGRVTGHSSIAGDIRADGPLRRPKDLNVVGDIGQVSAELQGIRLTNQGPVRFTLQNEVLKLEQFHIVGAETDITATGTISLAASRAVDLTANGRVNLQMVQSLNPAYNATGLMMLSMHATGSLPHPVYSGRLEISNASLSYIDLPNGVADVNGTLVFNQDRLEVQQLTARSGGGLLNIAGFVGLANGVDMNLTATAKEMRLRYPPGVSAMANADLKLTGTFNNSTLSGDITVTRFSLNQQFDFSLYLARAKQPAPTPDPKSPLNNIHLDVHIMSTPELQFQSSLAKLSGDVDLRVRGTAMKPSVLGRVNILEGTIFFNGTKYQLERGDITFSSPLAIEPILNVAATSRVREYDITIQLHGSINQLRSNYRSDPPLPEGDIIALLAFGRTREEALLNPQPTQNFTDTASNAILGQALNSVVSSRVERLFGVSKVKIDPAGSAFSSPNSPTTRSGPAVTIEQQVADKLTLTYITDVTQSAQQIISMEYNINRNVSIVAVRDQFGVLGIDIKIRQRKK